jgi:hypothetical protein
MVIRSPVALALLALGVTLLASPSVAAAEAAAAPVPAAPVPAAPAPAAPPPFAPGEQIDLVIDYLHVRTAQARLLVGRPEGAVWPVICQAKTNGLAMFLDIREHFVSYWDSEAQNSRGSDLNAIEVGDRHTDRARFDRANGKAVVQVVRKGKSKERTHDVPRDVHDLASALLALRLKDLTPGAVFEFPVFSGSETFELHAEVEGDEALTTPAGRFETVRVKVRLGFKGKFKTNRDSHVWLSKDGRHIPVRMTADFAVGSVTATLTGYRPGGQVAAR